MGFDRAFAVSETIIWYTHAGRHISFNTQVDHHRDAHNAQLFSSAFFFGDDYHGAHLILDYLGYAVYGGHGYSVHAAFDILVHGVSKIKYLPLPEEKQRPPQCISMAIYAHANVFAGAARYSGYFEEPKCYSDPSLWIPFYPSHFSLSETLRALKAK